MKSFFQKIKQKVSKKVIAGCTMLASAIGFAGSASAAPTTGDTDIDSILTTMDSGFVTAKNAFTYLALAAIPITLIVVLFFWLRGKFKQAVSGA